MYGQGLRSIRWRFALASGVLTCLALVLAAWIFGVGAPGDWRQWLLLAAPVALASGATYAMARMLTSQIDALRRSTEAIAAGDLNAAVDVTCQCEVGGLAQSFQKMATRLNGNLLRINALAYTDPITALPNRGVIDHLLNFSLAPPRRDQFRAAIVFIDLDGFKRINDTLGHDGGDELLRQAAHRILTRGLNRTLETIDGCTDAFGTPSERLPIDIVFARFAGDEFVAILPGQTDRAELARIGQSVIDALNEPFVVKGAQVNVGASVGIAIAPDDTRSAAELLSFADLAMYSSKQAGKSRYMFFDHSIHAAIVERAQVEADLRRALQGDELLLHYQPKVDGRKFEVEAVEALLRWQHPQQGLVLPGRFIAVAEQAGLMPQLGDRVLRLAVNQCCAWLDAGLRLPVAVNVSPIQFTQPRFVQNVLRLLEETGLPPQLLSIEITESMAMQEFEATEERLAVLRAAGVRVAVDDFGIGFSNLSQLSRLSVDELKIDRSLVKDIGLNSKSEDIIRAIVRMAQALGFRTIAEGIETVEQRDFLVTHGCDAMQGWLFGRAVVPEAFTSRAREGMAAPSRPPAATTS